MVPFISMPPSHNVNKNRPILSESLLCDTYVEEVIVLGSRKAVKNALL